MRIGFTTDHLSLFRFLSKQGEATGADFIRSTGNEPMSEEGQRLYAMIRTLTKHGYLTVTKTVGKSKSFAMTDKARTEIRSLAETARAVNGGT